ncbi:MAG: hypothetical protein QM682_09940 [Paracoccus sp. (in: a-proteobacteria)]|uniref:hypothetical protein n=1 Tax=Paracoccus sp. TaxID=267 RepID=UPI0039E4FCBC
MPPVDLRELKSAQTQAARSRLALENAVRAEAQARADLKARQAALEAAQRAGDQRGVQRLGVAIDKANAQLQDRLGARKDLQDRLRDRLGDLLRFGLDAPAEVPLLLLPLRLETRFGQDAGGKPLLKVRIYPDEIHVDRLRPGLTDPEAEAGRAYWSALFQAPDDSAIEAPWAALRQVTGPDRARHVAFATRPTNPQARGGTPAFPEVPALDPGAARPRLLPERFRISAWQGGQLLRAEGALVDRGLRIGLLSGDGAALKDNDGLKVLEGTEWLSDYDLALKLGMAIELPLPSNAPIERLFVYGVTQSRQPAEGAAALDELLGAHDGAARLAFVAPGTPTNNTEADAAGWMRWSDPAPVPLAAPALPQDSAAAIAARALGADPARLSGLAGAEAGDETLARAVNTALWPATWGYFLETLDDGQEALSPRVIEDLRIFHRDFLRGGGSLPSLRVGQQPYGILPFAGFSHRFSAQDAGRTEAGVESLTRKMLPNWLAGLPDVPVLDQGADAQRVLAIFGQAPQSWGVRARRCMSSDFLSRIQATTDQARPAAEIEGLLNQLLAESLGGLSYVYGAGSLDDESRPVALPYADPARDADYLQALLDGRGPGAISSVFQALVGLGWTQVKAAATPTRALPDAVRAVSTLDAALGQQVIALSTADETRDSRAYAQVLARIDAGPASRPASPRPVTMQADAAQRVLDATSAVERDRLGLALVESILIARARYADLRGALAALVELGRAGADFTRAVAQTLDSASHRLDAWILALSWARFTRVRAGTPQGLTVGAYGWLFDLRPQDRAAREGGYIAAPTLEQATTAGLLRSAYLAHNPADGTGGAFAIDLSSARVRRAQLLLQGVANGQSIGALLGYQFERRLREADCDRFILSFRGLAPLAAGKPDPQNPASDPEAQALALVNVTDMLRLLERWNAEGASAIHARLAQPPIGNPYLDDPSAWTGPDTDERKAIETAIDEGAADADALADLMLAESVHQLGQGNMARASAALDASGRGQAPPPELPDVVVSHGPGVIVSHRLIAVPDPARGWSRAAPRAAVSPLAEAWAAGLLPDPARVVIGAKAGGGRATLADTGLAALDFAAACRHPQMLARLVRARGPLANPDAAFPETDLGPQGIPLEEARLTGLALQDVLDRATALDGTGIGLPGNAGWQPRAGALTDAFGRISDAAAALSMRLGALRDLLALASVPRDRMAGALLALTDFGIALPDLSDRHSADIAVLALREGENRLARLGTVLALPATAESLAQAAEALFGAALPVPLPHVFAPAAPVDPADPGEPLGEHAFAPPPPGAMRRYLADMGAVRAPVGRFNRLALMSGIHGRGPALVLRQLCGFGENPPDRWIGAGLPADAVSPTCPVVSLLADAPAGLDLAQGVAGLLLDNWSETLPLREAGGAGASVAAVSRSTAGVALHADAPAAEPPQVLLLGLSPDRARWTEDSLCDFLADTLELAKARLITLETLPLAGRVLPAIYTQSWSLQGEQVIDWTRITLEARQLARLSGLKNFTMTKEG